MKRLMPYIFLLSCSLQPVINFATANTSDVSCSFARNATYFSILCATSIGGYLFLYKITKKNRLFCCLFVGTSVLLMFNLYYLDQALIALLGSIYRFRYFLISYLLLMFFLYYFTKKIAKNENNLSIIVVFVAAFIGTDLAVYIKSLDFNQSSKLTQKFQKSIINKATRPNIYYLIPDMFIGPEAFKHFSGQDLKIINELSARDFIVTPNTFSSASNTSMSLAQVFGMDYLLARYQLIGLNTQRELTEVYFKGENPVIPAFKERGYRYIRFADGYVSNCDGKEDHCYSKLKFFNTQDARFLERMKLISFLNHYLLKGNSLQFPGAIEPLDFLKYLPVKENKPFFLLMHLGLPHPPIRYDESCHLYPEGSQEYNHFNQEHELGISRQTRFNAIIPQIRCAENLVIKIIDAIVKNDPDSIFIVQADHGTSTQDQVNTAIEHFTQEQFLENFNILSAFRMPQECRKYIHVKHAPVNNFRIVFSCIDGSEPKILPPRSFITYYTGAGKLGEKTEIREWQADNFSASSSLSTS